MVYTLGLVQAEQASIDLPRDRVGVQEIVKQPLGAETRDAGVPVIVVSTELDEVVALADRIAVMYRGGIVGIVPGDTPREVLGLMMAGEVPASLASSTKEPAA